MTQLKELPYPCLSTKNKPHIQLGLILKANAIAAVLGYIDFLMLFASAKAIADCRVYIKENKLNFI